MKITPKNYASALHQALSEVQPASVDKVLDNFVKLLDEQGQTGQAEMIMEEFAQIDRQKRGIKFTRAIFSSSSSENETIFNSLHKLLGQNVELKKQVDSGLIGGVVIESDEDRVDLSFKKNLQDLKKSLIK